MARLSDGESAKVIALWTMQKFPYSVRWRQFDSGSRRQSPSHADAIGGPRHSPSEGSAFEIFDKPVLAFQTSFSAPYYDYVRGCRVIITRRFSQIDEVDSALVMIVLPENRLLLDRQISDGVRFVAFVHNFATSPQYSIRFRFLVAIPSKASTNPSP